MAEGGSLGFSEVRAAVAAKGVSNAECVQVVVRCRPMNSKEKEENRMHIVDIDTNLNQVSLKACEGGVARSFTFDGAFDEKTQQRPFYDDACFPLVESILEGFNATIFAYGQTGCGKSFSMQGPASPPAPPEMRGVIPNAFAHLFEFVKSTRDIEFLVRCSYLELYNEVVRDLLDTKTDKTCDIRQDPKKGIFVNNLSEVVVDTAEKIQAVLDRGLSGRTVAATAMNAESSRSHSIFTIIIEMSSKDPDTGRDILRAGKLNLVDLAGSERQKKTGAAGDILKQGAMINQSLTTLGNVIQSLAEAREHVPYRDSKLTRLLQDSLGGNTKTLMIAALSPADYNYDETLSTLRYANRAKNIKNKPKINEDPKDTLLRTYKDEIARLKKQLEEYMSGGGAPPGESEGGEGSSGTNAGNNLDMGALNNMMKMLSGESMSTEAITSHSSAKLAHDNASNFDPEALEGIDETENMDFAAFATAAPEAENSNSNLTPKSPRGEQPADVSPRSTKKRSPAKSATGKDDDDHEMLLAEHEYAHSLVKEKDHEIRLERQKAQEMTEKLRQLEAQLMGNMHAAFTPFGAADMAPGVEGDSISNAKMLPKETEFEIQERERARLEYEKRKQAIKNKREKKRARERNEKEEAQREREYLWDNLKEQSRALEDEIQEKKLYKSICEAVLSQKELRRVSSYRKCWCDWGMIIF